MRLLTFLICDVFIVEYAFNLVIHILEHKLFFYTFLNKFVVLDFLLLRVTTNLLMILYFFATYLQINITTGIY